MVGWMEDVTVYRATEVAHETLNLSNKINRGSWGRRRGAGRRTAHQDRKCWGMAVWKHCSWYVLTVRLAD